MSGSVVILCFIVFRSSICKVMQHETEKVNTFKQQSRSSAPFNPTSVSYHSLNEITLHAQHIGINIPLSVMQPLYSN